MEVKGITTLFKNTITTKDGEKSIFKTTISSKTEDGQYINLSIDVRFVGKKFSEEKLAKLDESKCHGIDIQKGFFSVRQYTNKDGVVCRVPVLVVEDAKYIGTKEMSKSENMPF